MSIRTAAALALALAFAGGGDLAAGPKAGADQEAGKAKKKADPLFPTRQRGWKHFPAEQRRAARELAGDYLSFLAAARTPRRAIATLTDVARAAGAVAIGGPSSAVPRRGGLYFFAARGGDAAAFFRPGSRPVSDGLRVVVVSVDAPRIELKQAPIFEKHGFAMLQTTLHGDLDLRSWMVHPLALHVHVSRGERPPLSVAIGDAPGDPVLSIPDLLPHLSRHVQDRRRTVTDPERLDALSARSRAALIEALAARGVSEDELAAAEAYLIPAGPPRLVGVDRALIGGYGQIDRSLAFAAIRALAAEDPERAAVVVAISRTAAGGGGSTGVAFARRALIRIIDASSSGDADVYDTQRALSRSLVLAGSRAESERNMGLVLAPRSADSLPAATAAVLAALERHGVQYQIDGSRATALGRELATLDLDAIDVALPISGAGAPAELLSVLDLYQGYRGCRAFFRR